MGGCLNLASLLVLTSVISVAQHSGSLTKEGSAMAFTLTTSAFASGAEIPNQYTCKGEDRSPALQWTGAPAKTASYAIIMDDPDAPAGVWVHWVIWDLPPSMAALQQGVSKGGRFMDGSQEGRNSFGKTGYNGPCPPPGQTHRYFFRLYALDGLLNLPADADRSQLDAAMKGHILAQTEYMGTFHR